MTKFENTEIPFQKFGKKTVLTRHQCIENPWLQEFVDRFPDCFEFSVNNDWYVYKPKESPKFP